MIGKVSIFISLILKLNGMGHFFEDQIEGAGLYLLGVLAKKNQINFDYLYDGSDQKHKILCEVFKVADTDDDSFVEILMDLAAAQLNEFGIVSITQLESTLFDDESNYQISLTDKGRKIIKNNQKIKFYSTTL